MSKESVFENMGTGFSSPEILQEPEVHEDLRMKISWNSEIWNILKLFDGFWLTSICIFDGKK